ncbi:hypothetical protein ACKLNO_00830 [Neisseriaceae bacterium B1]
MSYCVSGNSYTKRTSVAKIKDFDRWQPETFLYQSFTFRQPESLAK